MLNENLCMELSDCGSPEGLATIIHSHISLDNDGYTDLEAVAQAVGIKEIKPTSSDTYEGLLITDQAKSEGYILYNKNSPYLRRRFTIAHELGHFLILTHGENAQCASHDMKVTRTNNSNDKKEEEANRFATELLSPTKEVRKLISPYNEPSLEQIISIHKKFNISKESAVLRYIECTDHEVGIILARDSKIRYTLRTNDFPYIALNQNDDVPEHITKQLTNRNINEIIDWYCIDSDYFLSDSFATKEQELFCQTIIQNKGFHISLLMLEEK